MKLRHGTRRAGQTGGSSAAPYHLRLYEPLIAVMFSSLVYFGFFSSTIWVVPRGAAQPLADSYSGPHDGNSNGYLYNSCLGSNISATLAIRLPAREVDGSNNPSHFSWQEEILTSDRSVGYQAIAEFRQGSVGFWVEMLNFDGTGSVAYSPYQGGGFWYGSEAQNVMITVRTANNSVTWLYNVDGKSGSSRVGLPAYTPVAYEDVLVGSDSSSPVANFYNFTAAFEYSSSSPIHQMFSNGKACSAVGYWGTTETSNVSYAPPVWLTNSEAIQEVVGDWRGR